MSRRPSRRCIDQALACRTNGGRGAHFKVPATRKANGLARAPLANSAPAGVASPRSDSLSRVASHVEQRQGCWPSAASKLEGRAVATRRRTARRLESRAADQDGCTLPRPGRALPSRLREPSSCGGPRRRQRVPLCQPYGPCAARDLQQQTGASADCISWPTPVESSGRNA